MHFIERFDYTECVSNLICGLAKQLSVIYGFWRVSIGMTTKTHQNETRNVYFRRHERNQDYYLFSSVSFETAIILLSSRDLGHSHFGT